MFDALDCSRLDKSFEGGLLVAEELILQPYHYWTITAITEDYLHDFNF